MQDGLSGVSIEVVVHGQGLAMLIASKNGVVRERMKGHAEAGVVFAACQSAMARQGVRRDELVPFAITVASGVAEVVKKQETG